MNPVQYTDDRTDRTLLAVSDGPEGQNTVIAVVEEQLRVDKQLVETGRVLVSKTIREEEQVVTTPLIHEEISLERVPVNQYVEAVPATRYEGDVTIIPVVKEVAVVEKRLMLVEEIRLTKRQVTTEDTQRATVRREEVTVERVGPEEGRSV